MSRVAFSSANSLVARLSGRYDTLTVALADSIPPSTNAVETLGADGTGRALWQRSTTKGVRGAATCTSNGSSLTDGEYYVKITGSGTGASARVVVVGGQVNSYSDGSCDAVVLEPGSGWVNGAVATLSTSAADWFDFFSNGTLGTFTTPVFPAITFALADNLLSFRHTNGEEYVLDHEGDVSLRHFGVSLDRTVDSSAALQNAWRAMLRGRSQIDLLYGGGPRAGGRLLVPPGNIWLNGATIYLNSTGTPTGTQFVGLELAGTAKGSPRTTRPDGSHSGSRLVYGKLVLGDVNGTGVFNTVSRGAGLVNLSIIGGVECWNLQHAPKLEDLHIVPDNPVGVVASTGYRHDGWGFYAKNCSLIDLHRVIVTAGKQVYFGNKNRLNGILLDNCDHCIFTAGNAAFNIIPLWVRAPSAGVKSTIVEFNDWNFEGNVHAGPILEAVRGYKGDFSVITNNDTDTAQSFVEIGSVAETAFAVAVNGGSINGSPTLTTLTVTGTPANNQVQVEGDYTLRFAVSTALTITKGAGTITPNVSAVAYDYASDTTTVTVDVTTVDATCTAIRPTSIPGSVGFDVINAQGVSIKGASITNITTAVRFRAAAQDCNYERGAWSGGTTEVQADDGMTWAGAGLTWTPAVTFATPGDLSVSYSTQVGRYGRIPGTDLLYCEFDLVFTPTFTTASGAFGITGMPFPAANSAGINAGTITNISSAFSFGASKTMALPYINGTTQIGIRGMGSAQTASGLVATNLTSGVAHTLIGSVIYKI